MDEAELPDVRPAEYLIDLLYRIGPVQIQWSDLESWVRLTGINLTGWEAETVQRLSCIYQTGCTEYDDKDAEAPYLPEESQGKVQAHNIQSILRRPIVK